MQGSYFQALVGMWEIGRGRKDSRGGARLKKKKKCDCHVNQTGTCWRCNACIMQKTPLMRCRTEQIMKVGRGTEGKKREGRREVSHSPIVVICDRSEGSSEPLATIPTREGSELEPTTDRKLPQNITILISAWNV